MTSTPPLGPWAGSTHYAAWLELPEGEALVLDEALVSAARSLVQDHLADAVTQLAEPDAMALLDAVGLQTLPTEVVRTREEAVEAARSMGYPVVLKAAGRDRMAKTAAAGFAIDLEGPDASAGRLGPDGGVAR